MTLYGSKYACDGCGRFAGHAGEFYCDRCEADGTAVRLERQRMAQVEAAGRQQKASQ